MSISEQKKKYNQEYRQKCISDRDKCLERIRERFKSWGIIINDKEKLEKAYADLIDMYRRGYAQGYNDRVLRVDGIYPGDVSIVTAESAI